MVKIDNHLLKSGDRVICSIKGREIIDAKIHFDENSIFDTRNKAWICHNDAELMGDNSPVKYEYKYSWTFTIDDNGYTSDDVHDIHPLLPNTEVKENSSIDAELLYFIENNEWSSIIPLFHYKLGIFDEFYIYEKSLTEGCIILKNDRKSVEIKLSRFVRQMSNFFDDIASKSEGFCKMNIEDKTIESIYNKYVSYQKSDSFSISFLNGEDILKGYDRINYHPKNGGSLHQSCMVDRFDFLKIYTQNPNQVKLAVIYIADKIAARGLIWTTVDGEMFLDRIYYNHDWLDQFMKVKLQKVNILPIPSQQHKVIKLENWEFDYYPYLDTFYYFDRANGMLMNYPLLYAGTDLSDTASEKINTLRSTGGHIG